MTYYSRILHLVEVLRYEKGTMREDIKVWVQNHLEQHRRALALSCLVGVFLILPFGVRKFCETPERDIRKRAEEEARRATSAAQIITPDSETPSVGDSAQRSYHRLETGPGRMGLSQCSG